MKADIRSLADLKAAVAKHCGIGDPQATADAGNYTLATQLDAQRRICDFLSVEALMRNGDGSGNHSVRSERAEKRLRRRAQRFVAHARVERIGDDGKRVGFVPIIAILAGSVISWLIGKALEFIWGWLTKANAETVAAVYAQAEAEANLSDPGDDGGD